MKDSKIAWTDDTFNPWIGCTKVSEGCLHCYAEAQNARRKWAANGAWGPGIPRRRTGPDNWKKVRALNNVTVHLRCPGCGQLCQCKDMALAALCMCDIRVDDMPRTRPRLFCASLADWLDPEVPIDWLADLLALMWECRRIDWLMLTKRPQLLVSRMEQVLAMRGPETALESMVSNLHRAQCMASALLGRRKKNILTSAQHTEHIWFGTTVENQARAIERIPHALRAVAGRHFLSVEPMLGPVEHSCLEPMPGVAPIDWVICGGESGTGRRPFEHAWAADLARQCRIKKVPFFMKQDAAQRSGQRGSLPEELWALKEFPAGNGCGGDVWLEGKEGA